MQKDERLLPLPTAGSLKPNNSDYPANYSPLYDEEFEDRRSIREYFNIVYKRLPLILALTVLTTAVVAFYMYRQPSIYEARTEMVVEPRKPKVQSKDSININFGGDAYYYNTQLQLLQNPDLMREVVTRLNLHREPNLFSGQSRGIGSTLKAIISSEKDTADAQPSLPVLTNTEASDRNDQQAVLLPEERERANMYANILIGGLRVDQVKGTNLVNIVIQNSNPELAARVANGVGEVFIQKDIEREMEGGKKVLADLSKSIEELKGAISSQEMERIRYMQSSGLPLREGKGNDLLAERLQTLSGQWLSAEDERRKVQASYEAAQRASSKGDIYAVVGDNKAIENARNQNLIRKAELEKRIEAIDGQIQVAETEKAALLVKYQPEYPGVKIIDARIESLRENRDRIRNEVSQKIETEGKTLQSNAEREVLNGLRAQLESAQRREAQLRTAYMTEIRAANLQGQDEIRLTTLTREIETNRGLLDTYTQRQKEVELAVSSSKPDNLSISNYAQTPGAPIGPNRNRNIFIAFLISFLGGIGLAFLLDYLDDSVKSSDDVGRLLGLPTLALIPHHGTTGRNLGLLKSNQGPATETALAALTDTRSAVAEAYRHLRTSLLFSSAGKPPQTILVTSSQPAEGKTTTAVNTAITLAQAGVDVVIIDCDLRRPRLHHHFNLENATGLTNYLSGERNHDNLLKTYPGLPTLKIITSGPIPPNPTELLSSNEMKNLLQYLKGNFKHVVIDSPPAISFTDAAILSTVVDGVMLVALAGKSSIHLMRRFKQRLANLGARIYGVVLNDVKSSSVEYGYYGYGYGKYYNDASELDNSTPLMEEIISVHDTKD